MTSDETQIQMFTDWSTSDSFHRLPIQHQGKVSKFRSLEVIQVAVMIKISEICTKELFFQR